MMSRIKLYANGKLSDTRPLFDRLYSVFRHRMRLSLVLACMFFTACSSMQPENFQDISESKKNFIGETVLTIVDVSHLAQEWKPDGSTPSIDQNSSLANYWHIDGYIIADDVASITLHGGDIYKIDGSKTLYGVLAHTNLGDGTKSFLVAIRGTSDLVEWKVNALSVDNLLFDTTSGQFAGAASKGFYSIYQTFEYVPAGAPIGFQSKSPAWRDLKEVICDRNVTVAGHSLGAALAVYLAADLAENMPRDKVHGLFIALPRPGNPDFSNYFDKTVTDYLVVNYSRDVVPQLPPSLLGFVHRQLTNVFTIYPENYRLKITNNPGCNHHAVSYAAMLIGITPDMPFEFWKEKFSFPGDGISPGCFRKPD